MTRAWGKNEGFGAAGMLLLAASSGTWFMCAHSYWNNRFSPLRQINTSNVKNPVLRAVSTHGAKRLGSFENTPIVVNGIMYITSAATPNSCVRAFDLRTQKRLWQYEHKNASVSPAGWGPYNCGVAIAGGNVYVATLGGELVALDQRTGNEKWVTKVGDPAFGFTETMAPVVGGKVIIGTSGAEYGIRGFVKAWYELLVRPERRPLSPALPFKSEIGPVLLIALLGTLTVLAFDSLGAVASKKLSFRYALLAPGAFLIYGAVGYAAGGYAESMLAGAVAGALVGLADATLGWWVSWRIGPGRPADGHITPTRLIQAAGTMVLVALVCGFIGATLAIPE